jgi:hypothetical protein
MPSVIAKASTIIIHLFFILVMFNLSTVNVVLKVLNCQLSTLNSLVFLLLLLLSFLQLSRDVLCATGVIPPVDEALHKVIGTTQKFVVIADEMNKTL